MSSHSALRSASESTILGKHRISKFLQKRISGGKENLDKERSLDFRPISFPEFPFAVEIAKSGRNIALAGLYLLITMYQRHGLEAGYDFEYNSQYHTHFAYLSYNVRF